MAHADRWGESKFAIQGQTIRGSADPRELAPASRLIADLVGQFYARAIPQWVTGDLIDLGCGKAPLLGAYRRYCSSILLADWDSSLHPNPLLDLVIDLNSPLTQLKSGSFDAVLLSDVLEHIQEPAALMMEISRILRPGGYLLMNSPFIYQIHETPHDYFRYTRFALEKFAAESRLQVVELVPLGGWLAVLTDLSSKLLARMKLALLISVLQRLIIGISHTHIGQKLMTSGGEVIPIGYGMVARKP